MDSERLSEVTGSWVELLVTEESLEPCSVGALSCDNGISGISARSGHQSSGTHGQPDPATALHDASKPDHLQTLRMKVVLSFHKPLQVPLSAHLAHSSLALVVQPGIHVLYNIYHEISFDLSASGTPDPSQMTATYLIWYGVSCSKIVQLVTHLLLSVEYSNTSLQIEPISASDFHCLPFLLKGPA